MNMDLGTTGHLFASENALSVGSFLFYHDSQNVRKEAGALFESSPQRLYLLVSTIPWLIIVSQIISRYLTITIIDFRWELHKKNFWELIQ